MLQILPVVFHLHILFLGRRFAILEYDVVETVVSRKITSQAFEVFALFSANYIVGIIVVGKFLGIADGFNIG